jgi:hypothetical protein
VKHEYSIPGVVIFALASGCATDEDRPKPEEIWRLVAQSNVITTGTLRRIGLIETTIVSSSFHQMGHQGKVDSSPLGFRANPNIKIGPCLLKS